jgi:methylglyoxal synthase
MKIALVAHDSRKRELIEWVNYNMNELEKHDLYATGTTGKMIKQIGIKKSSNVNLPMDYDDNKGTYRYHDTTYTWNIKKLIQEIIYITEIHPQT